MSDGTGDTARTVVVLGGLRGLGSAVTARRS